MKISHLKVQDLTTSIALGGQYVKRLEVTLGSRHYIWDGRKFIEGICTQDQAVDVPISTFIPHLFQIASIIEATGVQPELFVVNGVGMGIIFQDIPQERSTPLITENT